MKESNQLFVEGLYRTILRREADADGIASGTLALESSPDRDSAAVNLVESLLGSDEYFSRSGSTTETMLRIVAPKEGRLINGMPVKHVISLGTHCLASSILQRFGLRRYSLPFDWMFTCPPSVEHCLKDEFRIFLDRRHYESITNRLTKEPGAQHKFYLKKYNVRDMITHRDPTENDVDYAYLKRTVSRFYNVMSLPDSKLFVMLARPHQRAHRMFSRLSKILGRLTVNSAFICIQMRAPTMRKGMRAMRLMRERNGDALYEFTPSSEEHGVMFHDQMDDLSVIQVIRQYQISLD